MAEIGLIASIVGVAGAAASVSITLFQIAGALGSAANEVRFVAADTSALSLVLTNLSNTLRNRKTPASEGEQIASAILLLCRSIMDDGKELVVHLNPLVEKNGSRMTDAALRVRWLFEKSKFGTHRQSLESLKTTLTLLVTTMSYSSATQVASSTLERDSLRIQVESLKAEIQLGNQGTNNIMLLLQSWSTSDAGLLEQAASSQLLTPPQDVFSTDSTLGSEPDGDVTNDTEIDDSTDAPAGKITNSTELTIYSGSHYDGDWEEFVRQYGYLTPNDLESGLAISFVQKQVVSYAVEVLQSKSERVSVEDFWNVQVEQQQQQQQQRPETPPPFTVQDVNTDGIPAQISSSKTTQDNDDSEVALKKMEIEIRRQEAMDKLEAMESSRKALQEKREEEKWIGSALEDKIKLQHYASRSRNPFKKASAILALKRLETERAEHIKRVTLFV